MVLDDLKSETDAARLLDANLTLRPNWFEGVRGHKLFRIPGFDARFNALSAVLKTSTPLSELLAQKGEQIAAKLRASAREAGSGRPWCEATFDRNQIDSATHGNGMRFDKAAIAVLAINDLVAEVEAGTNDEAIRTSAAGIRFGPHCIVACVFRFEINFDDLVDRAAGDLLDAYTDHLVFKGRDSESALEKARSVIHARLAAAAGQRTDFARNLTRPTDPGAARPMMRGASYPVLRAIYKALMQSPSCRNELPTEREDVIRQRAKGEPNMVASPEESVHEAEKITRPPFGWISSEANERLAQLERRPLDLPADFNLLSAPDS